MKKNIFWFCKCNLRLNYGNIVLREIYYRSLTSDFLVMDKGLRNSVLRWKPGRLQNSEVFIKVLSANSTPILTMHCNNRFGIHLNYLSL